MFRMTACDVNVMGLGPETTFSWWPGNGNHSAPVFAELWSWSLTRMDNAAFSPVKATISLTTHRSKRQQSALWLLSYWFIDATVISLLKG